MSWLRSSQRETLTRLRSWRLGMLLRVGFSLVLALFAAAEGASEYQVKAAYLYNFLKITEWPPEALPRADSALTLCVYGGDEDFLKVLRTTLAAKTIGAHPIEIKYLQSAMEIRACHLVFFRGAQSEARSVIATVEGSSILLVGESTDFLTSGGMLSLVLSDGKITYEANSDALGRSNLRFGAAASAHVTASFSSTQSAPDRRIRSQVSPMYPELAKKMGLKGAVQLKVTVRADGSVRDVQIVGGHPVLASAAADAVKKWRFEPTARETIESLKMSFGD